MSRTPSPGGASRNKKREKTMVEGEDHVDNLSSLHPMKVVKKGGDSNPMKMNTLSSISTTSGGSTFQADDTRDPMAELDVIIYIYIYICSTYIHICIYPMTCRY